MTGVLSSQVRPFAYCSILERERASGLHLHKGPQLGAVAEGTLLVFDENKNVFCFVLVLCNKSFFCSVLKYYIAMLLVLEP